MSEHPHILRWQPGQTPLESKWLYYFNGTTGEFIAYENLERQTWAHADR